MKVGLIASLLLAAVCPAATISVYPSSSQWISPAGENTGGGSTAITNNPARSGDGAAELHGDRTRFFTGYGNFGKLSDLTELSFEWMVPAYSISALSADLPPPSASPYSTRAGSAILC